MRRIRSGCCAVDEFRNVSRAHPSACFW